jgi:hypothetical protein
MGKPSLSFGLLVALFPSAASAQSVPEGIHSDATGPTAMCALRGRDARELMERVRAAANLRRSPIESDRFEVFESLDHHDQWVLTRPSEPAYPAVTCRHFYVENGSTFHTRNMRCDADRAACDRLFIEFRELDLQMMDYIRRMSGPVRSGT